MVTLDHQGGEKLQNKWHIVRTLLLHERNHSHLFKHICSLSITGLGLDISHSIGLHRANRVEIMLVDVIVYIYLLHAPEVGIFNIFISWHIHIPVGLTDSGIVNGWHGQVVGASFLALLQRFSGNLLLLGWQFFFSSMLLRRTTRTTCEIEQ